MATNTVKIDLNSSVKLARECGENIEKMMGLMANKTDEDRLVFWAVFFGNLAVTAVKQISPQTTLIILNNLISAIQNEEINSKFH